MIEQIDDPDKLILVLEKETREMVIAIGTGEDDNHSIGLDTETALELARTILEALGKVNHGI